MCYFCWSRKTNSWWNNLKHCLCGRDVPRHNGTLQTEHFVCVKTTQPEWVFVPCILQYRHIFCLKLSVRINLWSPIPVTCIWLELMAMVSLVVTLGRTLVRSESRMSKRWYLNLYYIHTKRVKYQSIYPKLLTVKTRASDWLVYWFIYF